MHCQRQAPAEASVLQEARAAWAAQPASAQQPPEQAASADLRAAVNSARLTAEDIRTRPPAESDSAAPARGTGPLLLFPDTSAMLAMLGAAPAAAAMTPLTMHLLEVRAPGSPPIKP